MANPEHLEIVRQGKEAIDAWRKAHSDERLDLIDADLSDKNLVGANLLRANLLRANLSRADLSGADLSEANLSGADLSMANLSETVFSRAVLIYTVFHQAIVPEANFGSAILGETVFADCDLSKAKYLDKVDQLIPSTIGIDTIYRSNGNIPEEFLRDAGVPETFITYARSLIGQPFQFYTCFISYASENQSFASRLYADLRAKGVRCWYYPESSTWGRRVWEDIDRGIRVYDKLVVICSKDSLHNPNVLEEIEKALNKERDIAKENQRRKEEALKKSEEPVLRDPDVLFPVRVDNYILQGWHHYLKDAVTSRNIGDFRGWDKDAKKHEASLNRLLNALGPKSWPAAEEARASS